MCVSSWVRAAPNTFPTLAKVGGNYISGALIKMEATLSGFAEGIALDSQGLVSEGSGENVFLVQNGRLLTPTLGSAVLPGITRNTIMTLAQERSYEVVEQQIPRESLYIADELFLTGTAARAHTRSLCRWNYSRQRQARTDHNPAPAGLLRLRRGEGR